MLRVCAFVHFALMQNEPKDQAKNTFPPTCHRTPTFFAGQRFIFLIHNLQSIPPQVERLALEILRHPKTSFLIS
jgi:hypothetical protein